MEFGGDRTEKREYFADTDVTVSSLLIKAAHVSDSGGESETCYCTLQVRTKEWASNFLFLLVQMQAITHANRLTVPRFPLKFTSWKASWNLTNVLQNFHIVEGHYLHDIDQVVVKETCNIIYIYLLDIVPYIRNTWNTHTRFSKPKHY